MFIEYIIVSARTGKTIGIYGISTNINKIIKDYETNGWRLSSELNYPIEPIQAKGEFIYIYMA